MHVTAVRFKGIDVDLSPPISGNSSLLNAALANNCKVSTYIHTRQNRFFDYCIGIEDVGCGKSRPTLYKQSRIFSIKWYVIRLLYYYTLFIPI